MQGLHDWAGQDRRPQDLPTEQDQCYNKGRTVEHVELLLAQVAQ